MEKKSNNGIIIFDEVSLIRLRVVQMFQNFDVPVYEAAYEVELFNLLSDEKANIKLVLMELGYDVNNGFDILLKIKEKKPNIPIIILTSNNKKQTFIRGIAEGASDYILKPFEDEYLVEKVLSILKKGTPEVEEAVNIVFDISSYLKAELKKARKGKYEITLLMCSLYDSKEDKNIRYESRNILLAELFYKTMKNDLWDTDIFERYGAMTFIGAFPCCGLENAEKLQHKFKDCFDKLKNEIKIAKTICLAIATITYPEVEKEAKELLITLGSRMHDAIDINENPNEKEDDSKI